MKDKKNIAIIFAGGVGSRMDTNDIPKQFLEVEDKPIIIHTLLNFEKHNDIDGIIISCLKEWIDYLDVKIKEFNITKVKSIIPGGTTGQDSIYKGLIEAKRLFTDNSNVLLHDGVRPYVKEELITGCIKQVNELGNAVAYTQCNETIIVSENGQNISSVPYRKNTFAGQAPQCFRLKEIIEAHDEIRAVNPTYDNIVDSCTLYNTLNKDIYLIKGHSGNIKITTQADYYQFKSLLEYDKMQSIGQSIPISDSIIKYIEKGEL
ncbi:MAG: IspD/TarI family cytidylyltransferase [bacterium]